MRKVYMRADENEAGVTVEDVRGGFPDTFSVYIELNRTRGIAITDTEARAVVEGLLRRMWENDGWGLTNAWYQKALENWLKSKDMGRQGEGR